MFGGAFEYYFGPGCRNFEQSNLQKAGWWWVLKLYIEQTIKIFSVPFSIHFHGIDEETSFNNPSFQEHRQPKLADLRSDKSNAESKHIYCSFISVHYQHDPPCETDAKPQITFKILSLEVSNDLHTHSLGHTIIENQLGNLPPLQTWA